MMFQIVHECSGYLSPNTGHMPIDFRQMMIYNLSKRVKIKSLIKALSNWRGTELVLPNCGKGTRPPRQMYNPVRRGHPPGVCNGI